MVVVVRRVDLWIAEPSTKSCSECGGMDDLYTELSTFATEKTQFSAETHGLSGVFHVSTVVHRNFGGFQRLLYTQIHSVKNAVTGVDTLYGYPLPICQVYDIHGYPDVMDHLSTGYPQNCG